MADYRTLFARGLGGMLAILALAAFFAELRDGGLRGDTWLLAAGLAYVLLTLKIRDEPDADTAGDEDGESPDRA
ncbi:MAG: hypothetical protein P1U88_19005 [Thalassobaculaceae bacterium]|nr:hypothetical protein [Thalassobaculaceae bacterium]